MTLLVAGQETSAILLGWACAFLAQHPEAQQRAAAEAQQVSPLSGAIKSCLPKGTAVHAILLSRAQNTHMQNLKV